MENNRECNHCSANHPELTVPLLEYGFGYQPHAENVSKMKEFEELLAREHRQWEACGLPLGRAVDSLRATRAFAPFACRSPNTASRRLLTPRSPAPGCLESSSSPTLGGLSVWTQPNSWHHFMSDHIVSFSVLPLAAEQNAAADPVAGPQGCPGRRRLRRQQALIRVDTFVEVCKPGKYTQHCVPDECRHENFVQVTPARDEWKKVCCPVLVRGVLAEGQGPAEVQAVPQVRDGPGLHVLLVLPARVRGGPLQEAGLRGEAGLLPRGAQGDVHEGAVLARPLGMAEALDCSFPKTCPKPQERRREPGDRVPDVPGAGPRAAAEEDLRLRQVVRFAGYFAQRSASASSTPPKRKANPPSVEQYGFALAAPASAEYVLLLSATALCAQRHWRALHQHGGQRCAHAIGTRVTAAVARKRSECALL